MARRRLTGCQYYRQRVSKFAGTQPPVHQRRKALEISLAHQLRRRLLPSGQVFRRRAEGQPPQKRGVHLADAFFRHSKAPFAGIIGFVPIMPRGGPYRKNKSRKNAG